MPSPERTGLVVSLSAGLYPWPGTGVLKLCFGNLLGVCEINATGIFSQDCSQVFLRLANV